MQRTTSDASVTTVIAQLAALLREQMLQARRIYLRGRAPKSKYVHQLRRDMAADKRKSFELLLAISMSDVEDGIAPSIVAQPYLSAVALLEERAREIAQQRGGPALAPDPVALIQRENRAQATKDECERDVIANPASPDALQRLLDADARYEAENDRMVSGIRWTYARAVSRRGMVSA
jgi:hypothetical protein